MTEITKQGSTVKAYYSVEIHKKVVQRYVQSLQSKGLNTTHEVLKSEFSAVPKPNDLLAAWPAKPKSGKPLVFTTLQRRVYNALVFHAKNDYKQRYPSQEEQERALAENRSLAFTISLSYLHRLLEDRTGQYQRTVQAIESLGQMIFNFSSGVKADDFSAEQGSLEELLEVRCQTALLGSIHYYERSQTVQYSIPAEFTLMLFSGSSPFTLLSLQVNNTLRSKTALALYELILREVNMLGVERLSRFRHPDYFALPMCGHAHRREDGNLEWAEFKRHALASALKEINSNPIIPIKISLDDEIQRGPKNKVIGIRFKISDRPQLVLDLSNDEPENPRPSELENLVSVGAQFGITIKGASGWLAKNKSIDRARLEKGFLEAQAKETIRRALKHKSDKELGFARGAEYQEFRPAAFFMWAISNDAADYFKTLSVQPSIPDPRLLASNKVPALDQTHYSNLINELKALRKMGLINSSAALKIKKELTYLSNLLGFSVEKDLIETSPEAEPSSKPTPEVILCPEDKSSVDILGYWKEFRAEFAKEGPIQSKIAQRDKPLSGIALTLFLQFLKLKKNISLVS